MTWLTQRVVEKYQEEEARVCLCIMVMSCLFSEVFVLFWVLAFLIPFLPFQANSLSLDLILDIFLESRSRIFSLAIIYIGLLVHVCFRLFRAKPYATQLASGHLLLKHLCHPTYLIPNSTRKNFSGLKKYH